MFLYHQGERYYVKRDMTVINKVEPIRDILLAMDNMHLTLDQIEEIIPMRFVNKHTGIPCIVSMDAYPHLQSVITKQKRYGTQAEKQVHPSSVAIYKEAYIFFSQFRFVYTYDSSYENVIAKQLGMKWESEGVKRMLLVPECFEKEYRTLITEELPIIEDIAIEDVVVEPDIEIEDLETPADKQEEVDGIVDELNKESLDTIHDELPDMSEEAPNGFSEEKL